MSEDDPTVRRVLTWTTDAAGGSTSTVNLGKTDGRVSFSLRWSSPYGAQAQESPNGDWDACTVDNCYGSAIDGSGLCLVHSTPGNQDTYLQGKPQPNPPIDVRGTRLSEGLWQDIVMAMARNNRMLLASAAELPFPVELSDLTFPAHVSMLACRFEGPIHGQRASFGNGVDLRSSIFLQSTGLFECDVHGDVFLDGCQTLGGDFVFSGTFAGSVSARQMRGRLRFDAADIAGDCDVSYFQGGQLNLRGTTVGGELTLDEAHPQWALLQGMSTSSNRLGPIHAEYLVDLARAKFTQRINLDLHSPRVDMSRANLAHGGTVEIHGASVNLTGLTVSDDLHVRGSDGTSIEALSGADLARMTLSMFDMSTCELYGASGLSSVVLESTVELRRPTGWRTRRRCIYDEVIWRSRRRGLGAKYWHRWLKQVPIEEGEPPPRQPRVLSPRQIETAYRSLRQSLEGRSDYAGAADFYYGEMEMRRLDPVSSWIERFILTTYWALSGYGLRASRALAALGIAASVGACCFVRFGLAVRCPTWGDAFLAAGQSIVPGLSISHPVTDRGGFVDLVLSVLGPILLGLAALALRGRTRR